ncbi:hypothetical protein AB4525_08155 [Vibrio breoganii]|uniref:Uncharacterized protein n=1 Tax=Vibrio breoganii TaxID=553239 RepID=A0AAP8SY32_9VIBR|nr:hypothetical protein [Vibrio breoganii]PMK31591.1 hypothetical protein BCU03_06915 [Vibrio breoganii]PMK78559.1 hypothetical protein BCT94_05590 [Vibrio breoganii]PMP13998.1 hypothetical protein BCS93_04200 [Vibrio breoganii]
MFYLSSSMIVKSILVIIAVLALMSLSNNPAQLVAAALLLLPVVLCCVVTLKTLRFFKPFVKNVLLRVLPEPPVPHYALSRSSVQSSAKKSKTLSIGQRLMDIPAYARKETNTCYPMSLDVLNGTKPVASNVQTNF